MSVTTSLLPLIEQLLKEVADFREHLELAAKMSDDTRVQAFILHANEEEAGRYQRLEALYSELSQAEKTGSLPALKGEQQEAAFGEEHGHYRLRDLNELTVGALLGVAQ